MAEFRLVARGQQQHFFNPLPYFFFIRRLKDTQLPFVWTKSFNLPEILVWKDHQASRMSPFVTLLLPTKNYPLLFLWGLKLTGNNLCPSLFVTLFSYDGDMLLRMGFFTAGGQKIWVPEFIASSKIRLFSFRRTVVSSIRRQMVLFLLVTSHCFLCFCT
jgi:hypothetical protein